MVEGLLSGRTSGCGASRWGIRRSDELVEVPVVEVTRQWWDWSFEAIIVLGLN